MKKAFNIQCLLIFTLFFNLVANGQNKTYINLHTIPSLSWKEQDNSKVKLVNSFGLSVGYELNKRFSAELGLGLNKVGYKLIRVVNEIGVINGYNSYTLVGEIPVKQKFTEKSIGIPCQINYFIKRSSKLAVSIYSNVALNLYYKRTAENWYYYKTDREFKTKNTFSGTRGKDKIVWSYQFGFDYQRKLFENLFLGTGLNYQIYQYQHFFPLLPEKRKFHNIGLKLFLKYKLTKKD